MLSGHFLPISSNVTKIKINLPKVEKIKLHILKTSDDLFIQKSSHYVFFLIFVLDLIKCIKLIFKTK